MSSNDISQRIDQHIRDVADFPKPGILFKDLTPILLNPSLCADISTSFAEMVKDWEIDMICGVESRGFFFGPLLSQQLDRPFIPVRKAGKLPGETASYTYDLEYGSATIEVHKEDVKKGQRILVHDDLLATGGTALASAKLLESLGAEIVGFCFVVELSFLGGRKKIQEEYERLGSLIVY